MISRLGANLFALVSLNLILSLPLLWFVIHGRWISFSKETTFNNIMLPMLIFPAQPGRKYFHAPLYCWPKRKELLSLFTFTSGVFWLKTNSVHDWLFQIVDSISASDWSFVFKRFPLLSLKNEIPDQLPSFILSCFSLEKTSFFLAFPSKRLLSFYRKKRFLRSFKIYFYHLG